jgi:hypothetical protein
MQTLFDYEAYLSLIEKTLSIYGQPCTVYKPSNLKAYGYEDIRTSEQSYGSSELVNTYTSFQTTCWVEWNIPRKVLYHFNWFPDDSDELSLAFFNVTAEVNVSDYVRLAQPGNPSIWGDTVLQVKTIKDDGKFKTLLRSYFLKPVVSSELNRLLEAN